MRGSAPDADETELKKYAYRAARTGGVDPATVFAIIDTESQWDPSAVNRGGGGNGAHGIGQFREDAMDQFGITNPYDPYQSIDGIVKYLKHSEKEGFTGLDVPISYHDGIRGRRDIKAGRRDGAASRAYERRINSRLNHYRENGLSEYEN